jgi:hypothetical protein
MILYWMTCQWNDLSMKWLVNEMTCWWNDLSMKWLVDEMTCWWSGLSMKWLVDEMTCQWNDMSMKWLVNEMTCRWNDVSMKWLVDEMTCWWNDFSMKLIVDEMNLNNTLLILLMKWLLMKWLLTKCLYAFWHVAVIAATFSFLFLFPHFAKKYKSVILSSLENAIFLNYFDRKQLFFFVCLKWSKKKKKDRINWPLMPWLTQKLLIIFLCCKHGTLNLPYLLAKCEGCKCLFFGYNHQLTDLYAGEVDRL